MHPKPLVARFLAAALTLSLTIGLAFTSAPPANAAPAADTALDIITTVDVFPVLPSKIQVAQEGGGSELTAVTWDTASIDRSQWSTPGTYYITGSYAGGTATVTVTVTAERGLPEVATPYLGWNSWYAMTRNISEASIKTQVLALEAKGVTAAGYDIIWLDEGWWQTSDPYRTDDGYIAPNSRFPDMGAFADWLHARGLKLGLYADPASRACGNGYGFGGDNWFENYRKDVAQMVEWGVDAIKMDHCGGHDDVRAGDEYYSKKYNFQLYAAFYQALREADPEGTIIFDTCEWGQENTPDWAYKIANGYRISDDLGHLALPAPNATFWDYWEHSVNPGGHTPGAYNDADYLVIDALSTYATFTPAGFRTYFSAWAFAGLPLILSTLAPNLAAANVATITNADMLSIDQDPLAIQPMLIREDYAGLQVWARPLADKDGKKRAAVMLVNRNDTPGTVGFDWSDAGLANVTAVRNVWEGVNEVPAASYSTAVFPAEVTVLIAEGDATTVTSGFPQYNYAPQSFITVSSSTTDGGGNKSAHRAQHVADFKAATTWLPGRDLYGTNWIEVDFRQTRTVDSVVLNVNAAVGAGTWLEYLDGGDWTLAETLPALTAGENEITLGTSVSTTAIRLVIPSGQSIEIREFEVYGPDKVTSGYTSLADPITATPVTPVNYFAGCGMAAPANPIATESGSYNASYNASKVCDGSYSLTAVNTAGNRWDSGHSDTSNDWIAYAWDTPITDAGTLRVIYGAYWQRNKHTVIRYNDGTYGSDYTTWPVLAEIEADGGAGFVQGAPDVYIDVTGKTIQALRFNFTEVVALLGPNAEATVAEIELLSVVSRDPVYVEPVLITVDAGVTPVLPDSVKVRYDDGTWGTAPVIWDSSVPASAYVIDAEGGTYVITGTAGTMAALANVVIVPRPGTLADLQAIVDANKDRVQADYASGAWPAFVSALADAQAALAADPEPTRSQIVVVAAALEDAVADLVETKDLTALVANVTGADAFESEFDPADWAAFEQALGDAQGVLADPNPTVQDVADALAALQAAVAAMETENLALAPKATASVSSCYNSTSCATATYGAGKLNDGIRITSPENSATSRWNSDSGKSDGEWAQLEWASPVVVNTARVYLGIWHTRIGIAHIQYFDGEDWVTLGTIAQTPTAGQVQAAAVVDVPFGNVSVTKLRLFYEDAIVGTGTAAGDPLPCVFEIEVYKVPVLAVDAPAVADTLTGAAPELPETVTLTLFGGARVEAAVDWDSIPSGSLESAGTFTVTGAIVGTSTSATATVTVVARGDTGALADLLSGARALLDSGTLTAAAIAALEGPVADAEAMLSGSPDFTQAQVDVVFDALLAAVGQAQLDTSKVGSPMSVELLEALVTLAEAIPTDRYTDVSVAVLLEKLEAARAVLADAGRSQADVEAAIAGVQDAVAGLRNHYVTQLVTNVTALNLVKKKTFQLGATSLLTDGSVEVPASIVSSDPTIVTVDAKGKLKGISVGTATVTVTSATVGVDHSPVVVSIPVTVVAKSVSPKTVAAVVPATLEVGDAVAIPVTYTLEGATPSKVSFKSSSKKVATVDAAGVVKAVKPGKVKITVYAGSKKKTYSIAVAQIVAPSVVPVISGTLTVDQMLTVDPGVWGPGVVSLSYQWYRGSKAIAGATGATYVLDAADAGKTVKVKVTGTKPGYNTVSKSSKATKKIAKAAFLDQPVPLVSGTPTVGQVLTADAGVWTPVPDKFVFQWYRSGKAISKATSATYMLVAADAGKEISVKVTASKAGYSTVSLVSDKTPAVAAA